MAWDYQHASREAQDSIVSSWERTPAQAMGKDQLGGRRCLGTIPEEENGAWDEATPLAVEVSIWFVEPAVHSKYRRTYTSSLNFAPSNKICHGLLRRIEHCTEELITRKDSEALQKLKPGKFIPKPLRFGLTFKIRRRGFEEYTQRSFASYQKHPLTAEDAKEIILSTDRTVGLFLKHHDKEFKWLGGPLNDMPPMKPVDAPLSVHRLVSADCVPCAIFNADLQSFEARPGYFLELSLVSSNSRRKTPRFKKVIRVYSQQTAPLTLFDGEDIFDRGLDAVLSALLLRKSSFEDHLRSCAAAGCLHHHEHAVNIHLRVVNNLAPRHDHLHQTLRSKLVLFRDPDAYDCLQFLTEIEHHLHDSRDLVDAKISRMNDFEFKIVQLQGLGWSTNNFTPICLGSEASYSRRTVEAALSRIQTGIGDVIRSQDVAIHFTAYKRGHLLVDKALVARRKSGKTKERFGSAEEEKSTVLNRLRIRIQKDLDMVCKDTYCLDDLADDDQDEASMEVRRESEQFAEDLPSHMAEISASGDEDLLQARQRQETENQFLPDGLSQNPSSKYPGSIATILAEDDFEEPTRPSSLDVASIDLTATDKTVQTARVQRVFPLVPSSYSLSTRIDGSSIVVNEISDAEARAPSEDDLEDQAYSGMSREVQIIESPSAGNAKLEQAQGAALPAILEQEKDDENTKHALMQSQEGGDTEATSESARDTCTTEMIGAGDDATTAFDGPELEPLHEEASRRSGNGFGQAPDDPADEQTGPSSPWKPSTLLSSTNPQSVVAVYIRTPMSPMDDFSRTRMDILETVGYDEEPDVSVDSIEMSKCETRNSIGSIESDEEGPSTVPSTPGLSDGAESPLRQGLLKRPISPRCLSGLRDAFDTDMQLFYSPEIPHSGPESDAGTVALGNISMESETVDGYEPRSVLARLEPIPVPENAEESSTTSSLTITVPENGLTELSYSRIEPESPILLSDARVETGLENTEPREPLVSAHMQTGSHSTQSRISGSDRAMSEVLEPANFKGLEGVSNIPVPELTAEPWPDSESASTPGPETPILPVLSLSENESDVFEILETEAQPKPLGSIGLNFSREEPNPLSAGHPVAVSCEPERGLVEPTSTMSATQILVPALEPALAEFPSHASVPLGAASLGEDSELSVVKHIKGDAPLSPEGMHASRDQAYLAYLVPAQDISTRSSRSTLTQVSGTDTSQPQPGGRGSVEDVIAFGSEETSPSDSGYTYRPQTAGYLGLHETRLVEVGLRGALGGARRHSLPLQQLPRASTLIEPVPVSPGSAKQTRPRRDRKRRPKSTGTIGPAEQSDNDGVLPRVMMLFAGMAVASRFLSKPS